MPKLTHMLAACVVLAAIGGIIACTSRPATSRDADQKSAASPKTTVAADSAAAKVVPLPRNGS